MNTIIVYTTIAALAVIAYLVIRYQERRDQLSES